MFPLNWNDPVIKKDGSRTTLADYAGGGGGGGSSELPAHTIADAGKVLMVDDTNTLVWGSVSSSNRYAAPKTNVIVDVNSKSEGGN